MTDEKYRRCASCRADAVRTKTGAYYCVKERRSVATERMTAAEQDLAARAENREFLAAYASFRLDEAQQ